MSILTGIMVYLMIFWTVLFMVLPWGNRAPDAPDIGHAGSAPANPRIGQKFLWTGIISTGIWVMIWLLIQANVIDFYAIASMMAAEDKIQ